MFEKRGLWMLLGPLISRSRISFTVANSEECAGGGEARVPAEGEMVVEVVERMATRLEVLELLVLALATPRSSNWRTGSFMIWF